MKKRITVLALSFLLLLGQAGAVLSVEDARTLVERLYIDEVPRAVLESQTVEGLFAGLDRYSIYYSPEEYEAFLGSMNDAAMVGVGIASAYNEDHTALTVVQVMDDGAAHRGGIVVGDEILAVDGKPVAGASGQEEAAGWMKGEADTPVTLTIRRADGRVTDVTLIRAPFTVSYTNYDMADGHTGYISCRSFGGQTYDRFVKAVKAMEGAADRWIVDLRDNSGGLTMASVQAVGIFNGKGCQSLMRNRAGEYYGLFSREEVQTIYPVLVLVNGKSASASEQFSAAVRDHGTGLVIGSRTFGKGVAQTVVDQTTEPDLFADGDAVRITSDRFYSPEGLVNDTIGVFPHLMVGEEFVEDIALLLDHRDPGADNRDILRLRIGNWRWYIRWKDALAAGQGPALQELLEALLPDAEICCGAGNNGWEPVTAAEAARRMGLEGYQPRWFADAEGSPYRYALNALKTYGILRGDENGNCNPAQPLTRAELCAMLAQAVRAPEPARTNWFTDVPEDAWYASAVNAVAAMGFVQGDGTAFYPEKVLTNEELITVMSRVCAWLSVERYETVKAGPGEGGLERNDLAAYSDWAKEAAWLLGRSQYNYFGDYVTYLWADVSEIDPDAAAVRGTAAYSLWRAMDLLEILVQ